MCTRPSATTGFAPLLRISGTSGGIVGPGPSQGALLDGTIEKGAHVAVR